MSRVAAAETFGDEYLDLLAQQLFARVAEYIFGLGVYHNDLALSVGDHDGIGRGFEQASKVGFGWNSVGRSRSIHSLKSRAAL